MRDTTNFPKMLCFQTDARCVTEERAFPAYNTANVCHLPKFFRVWTDQEQIPFWQDLQDPGWVMRYNAGDANETTDRWSTTCGEPATVQTQWQLLMGVEFDDLSQSLKIRYELSVTWTVGFQVSKDVFFIRLDRPNRQHSQLIPTMTPVAGQPSGIIFPIYCDPYPCVRGEPCPAWECPI